ncbi:MAG: hypothetical protein IJD04_02505 [Desulfovibrionaceae bacterium]|nr:hypothetical protein [Desulfovibrionaceae bacterium]
MHRVFLALLIGALAATPALAKDKPAPGLSANTPLVLESTGKVTVNGQNVPLSTITHQDSGYLLPDGNGGLIWSQGEQPRPQMSPSYIDAREIKLQVREIAEQLLANIRQQELRGKIALPTSFVNQENFGQTSAFGRYIAEQMFHEFNQRGFQTREYRLSGQNIRMDEGIGDFYLSRSKGKVTATDRANVVLVGTYYHDGMNVFVNARLIRPSDGYVYRTAQMVMPLTETTRTMLARTGRRLERCDVQIVSKEWAMERTSAGRQRGHGNVPAGVSDSGQAASTPLDQGFDIH